MRNYYPLPKPVTEDVPYTVTVSLIGGTGFTEDFPSYSTALEYYDSYRIGGYNDSPKVSQISLRPTAKPQSEVDAEVRATIAKL